MKLETKSGNPGKGNWAQATRISPGNYLIVHHRSLEGWPLAIAIFHEWCHVWCWEYLPFADIVKEHKFIGAIERSLKRHKNKYWECK